MSLNPQWSPFQPPLNSDLDTSAILDLKLNQASNRNTSMNLGTLGSKAPGGLTGRPQALLSQVGLFGTGTVTTSSNFLSNSSAASTLFSNNAGVIGSSSTSNSLFGIAPTITTPSYINFPKGISGNSGSTRSVGSLGLNGSSNGPGFGPTGGNAGLGIGLSNGASTNNSLLSMVPNHARNVALSSLSSKSNSQLISSSAFGLGNSANSSPTNLLRNVNAGSGLSSPFSGNSSSFFSERPTSSRVSPIPNNLMGAIGRESPGLFRSQSQPASSSPPGGDIFSQADMFFPDSMGNSGSKMFQGGTSSSNMFKNSGSHSLSGNNDQGNQGLRETGIIEKLLHSYGFIQCCERQARLFFHFSQFDGNIEHLKIGDPVEFEMTYDRRTGKPIASAVTKISSDVLTQQVLGEERVMGTVTTAILNEGESNEVQGRISYENRGECFFLPYGKGDIEGNVNLRPGDKVSFQIATDQRTGNLAARCVRLEDPAQPVRYQGVVCSMKDNFGFIERGDVVREIFFHLTECKGEVKLGQDVEFSIQTRNGKEVATNITLLPAGTVIFEDVEAETIKGQVLKTVEKGAMRQPNEPLSGRIRFRGKDRSEVEIQFGERDMKGEFSLRHGDWVCFNIATDRRDKLQRATNISLLDESFVVSGEKREQGIISTLKEDLGYIKCVEREANLFFNVNEVLDVSQKLAVDNEVEFTVIQDPSTPNRLMGIRIKPLAQGTVKFDTILKESVNGIVSREAQATPAPFKTSQPGSPTNSPDLIILTDETPPADSSGLITYEIEGIQASIPYYFKDCEIRSIPKLGDKVEFSVSQLKSTKQVLAVNVKVIVPAVVKNGLVKGCVGPYHGFVAALKDGFGFIETSAHDREVFFHFSNYEGEPENLELGQEVEYLVNAKSQATGKPSAESVKPLSPGTIPSPELQPEVLDGIVIRPVRSMNPDQSEYPGLIQVGMDENGETYTYEFGITSLVNKREILQKGDPVQFQLEVGAERVGNLRSCRKKLRATVDSIKGQFGFLSHEMEDGKKLFFHMSEVKDSAPLQQGDQVEFFLVINPRNKKSSACSVVKIGEMQRPERLITKLRSLNVDDQGRRMLVLRQPKGPDGTKGFAVPRTPVNYASTV